MGAVFTFARTKGSLLLKDMADRGDTRFLFKDIIGESQAMRETLDKAKRFAKGPSTILILGESGTGKELFAQAIHNASDRRNGPFISMNCGAIPAELIQSELFGHVEGAFTGARKGGRAGKLEQANGGSIFLDEIGEMPLNMQVNLLRVLEEQAIVRLGDSKVVPVDVRILAATNRSLFEEVARGRFREDLFYRLNVISLFIPPLRERAGDVPLLIRYFLDRMSLKVGKTVRNVEPAAMEALEAHHWPGNVRELANAFEYALNMLQGEDLLLSHLPPYLKKEQKAKPAPDDVDLLPLHLVEKKAIHNALVYFDGNISKAANSLGIGRNTLYDKMKKYGIRNGS
jgi:transcriptional regulator with PAS, ATPase and Fis domain